LQPGVPSLARCVTLQPATFWNLGLGDPPSSGNKRIVFISYSFTEASRDHLKLLLDAEREDVVLSLRFIVNYRARPDDRRVT
jgi:hypothetical protein